MTSTEKTARAIFTQIEPMLGKQAIILALEGPLGAGKTTLTKHLGKLLGIKEIIISPTFVLNTEYKIPDSDIFLQHIDCWRLDSFAELENIGLKNMIAAKAVIVLEWADRFEFEIRNLKFKNILIWIKISYDDNNPKERLIEIV